MSEYVKNTTVRALRIVRVEIMDNYYRFLLVSENGKEWTLNLTPLESYELRRTMDMSQPVIMKDRFLVQHPSGFIEIMTEREFFRTYHDPMNIKYTVSNNVAEYVHS